MDVNKSNIYQKTQKPSNLNTHYGSFDQMNSTSSLLKVETARVLMNIS